CPKREGKSVNLVPATERILLKPRPGVVCSPMRGKCVNRPHWRNRWTVMLSSPAARACDADAQSPPRNGESPRQGVHIDVGKNRREPPRMDRRSDRELLRDDVSR